ncbi:MAG: serine hydrolase domain-containing protein [Desulfobaccales bacterium]
MRRIFFSLTFLALLAVTATVTLVCQTTCNEAPSSTTQAAQPPQITKNAPEVPVVEEDPRFAPVGVAAQEELDAAQIPGAVVLVGHQGRVVYRKAFGLRSLEPLPQSMTVDTIFDIASLTKVVATTPAIMQLSDQGLLSIDDPVVKYWPEFGQNGKNVITLRQLLTHTSGLREEINPGPNWSNYQGALEAIAVDRLIRPPGIKFHYSDVDFIVLGEIVQRVSGQQLDVYCTEKIFQPLKMRQTTFNPPENWRPNIAPSDKQNGCWRWGKVQDPDAYKFGGVAGHAGVFSTADDLSLFAQMLLNGGESHGVRILSRGAVVAMTKPYVIPGSPIRRGLGWDIQSHFSAEFNASFPVGSFGHTGYTGTSIWIDPSSQTYLIILTNRLHPRGKRDIKTLRTKVAAAVAAAVPMGPPAGVLEEGK